MDPMIEQKKLEKKLIASIIILMVGILLYLSAYLYLNPRYAQLTATIGNTASIARDISAVETQRDNYQALLDSSGKEYSNIITAKEGYISFLGNLSMCNNLKINKMTVDDVKPLNKNLSEMTVEIELQGNLYNVRNLVKQLYDSEIISRISAFSYRLQTEEDFPWMWRSIDDVTLVPWWDLGDVTAPVQPGLLIPGEEVNPLCADDLLRHGTALCYLQVEFIGVGG